MKSTRSATVTLALLLCSAGCGDWAAQLGTNRVDIRLIVEFDSAPSNDEPLRSWIAQQPGVRNVRVERTGNTVVVNYSIDPENAMKLRVPPLEQLGYGLNRLKVMHRGGRVNVVDIPEGLVPEGLGGYPSEINPRTPPRFPPRHPGVARAPFGQTSPQSPGASDDLGAYHPPPGPSDSFGTHPPSPGPSDRFGAYASAPGPAGNFGASSPPPGASDSFGAYAPPPGTSDSFGASPAPQFRPPANPRGPAQQPGQSWTYPISKETVDAWTQAGAWCGWIQEDQVPSFVNVPQTRLDFVPADLGSSDDLPAFRFFPPPRAGVISKLPAPKVPFGIVFVGSFESDVSLQDLASFKNLHVLDVSGCAISDGGLKELSGLDNLEILLLTRTRITNAGLKALAQLKQLKVLHLDWTDITDAAVGELSKMKNLQELKVGPSNMTRAGAGRLQRALPNCAVIY